MSDMMFFPASWEDFLQEYSFKDKEEIYTNGADLISVFRVRQMMEHYHHDWISVKDRLPDNNLYVLVTYYDLGIKDYCISIGAYHAKENVWVDDTFTKIINVTAWMPLPQPLKESDAE